MVARSIRFPIGAAENQRQPVARDALRRRQRQRVAGHRSESDQRHDDHDGRLVWEIDVVQHAERRAGVPHVREIEETRE